MSKLQGPKGQDNSAQGFPQVYRWACFPGHFGPRIGNVQTPSGRMTLNTYGRFVYADFPKLQATLPPFTFADPPTRRSADPFLLRAV